MRNLNLAKRYAQTLLEVGQRRGHLEVIAKQAIALYQVIESNDAFAAYLKNPVIKSSDKVEFLNSTLSQFDDTLLLFIKLVGQKKRLNCLYEILMSFENLYLAQQGIKKALIVSAQPLSENQIEKIKLTLSERIKAQLQITTKIQKDLIGGFYAKIDDDILDVTIKSKLEFIEKKLLSVG